MVFLFAARPTSPSESHGLPGNGQSPSLCSRRTHGYGYGVVLHRRVAMALVCMGGWGRGDGAKSAATSSAWSSREAAEAGPVGKSSSGPDHHRARHQRPFLSLSVLFTWPSASASTSVGPAAGWRSGIKGTWRCSHCPTTTTSRWDLRLCGSRERGASVGLAWRTGFPRPLRALFEVPSCKPSEFRFPRGSERGPKGGKR